MNAPPRPDYRKTLPEVLTRHEVAKLFGIQPNIVSRHDDILHPFRTPNGHRRWHRDIVLDAYEERLTERRS